MKILRQAFIEEILRDLDRFLLTRHAFDYSFNSENGEIVKLTYKDRPDFLFVIQQPIKGGEWITTECPGVNFINEEKYSLRDLNACRGRIQGWMNRVVEELAFRSNNSIDLLSKLRENLESNTDNLPDPDTPFDENDANDWSNRLDDIVVQIQKLEEENKIQKGRVHRLKSELEQLKKQVHFIPKKTWVKAAGNKILNFFGAVADTAVKALAEATVKRLIGGDN